MSADVELMRDLTYRKRIGRGDCPAQAIREISESELDKPSDPLQYAKLPDDISERYCLLLDPMLGQLPRTVRKELS